MLKEEERGRATMGRYGVQCSFQQGKPMKPAEEYAVKIINYPPDCLAVISQVIEDARGSVDSMRALESYPDFEGVIGRRGQQFIFDAKVCNQASFPLDKDSKSQSRQLRHMLKRSAFGAVCFYLIHFPERVMATKTEAEEPWAFPVYAGHPFWDQFERGEVKRISRAEGRLHGVIVQWDAPTPRSKNLSPNILDAILTLAEAPRTARMPAADQPPTLKIAAPF
jgi:hypothetical protein